MYLLFFLCVCLVFLSNLTHRSQRMGLKLFWIVLKLWTYHPGKPIQMLGAVSRIILPGSDILLFVLLHWNLEIAKIILNLLQEILLSRELTFKYVCMYTTNEINIRNNCGYNKLLNDCDYKIPCKHKLV